MPAKEPVPSEPKKIGRIVGIFFLILVLMFVFVAGVLVIIPAGYVGVDYSAWGGVKLDSVRTPGWSFKLPLVQQVYQIKTARDTISMYGTFAECQKDPQCKDTALQVPSKEGLLITLDVSVLYSVRPETAPRIVQDYTTNYVDGTITPEIRSAAREVTGTMSITDLYGAGRELLQTEIAKKLNDLFNKDGFILEQVLVRNVEYPEQIRKAIEEKQAAEQVSFKKQFEIDISQKEATRKQIEGEGIANNKIAVAKGEAESLRQVSQAIRENPEVLKFKQLEVLSKLYENPNTKFIALPSGQMILPIDFEKQIGMP